MKISFTNKEVMTLKFRKFSRNTSGNINMNANERVDDVIASLLAIYCVHDKILKFFNIFCPNW